jgi:hypothetical protein
MQGAFPIARDADLPVDLLFELRRMNEYNISADIQDI